MNTFLLWLAHHANRQRLIDRLRLIESAEEVDPASYNQVFDTELETLRLGMSNLSASAKLENLKGMDWAGYIAKELRRAGIRGSDVEEHLHQIVIKLLVIPGKLFHGWNPDQHGPMDRRFGASVRNEIRSIISKQANRRKYIPTVTIHNRYGPGGIASKHLAAPDNDAHTLIDDFREWLRQKLGDLAVAVFDARLVGDDVSLLAGMKSLGSPSNTKLRTIVQEIKRSALEYAHADADLHQRIQDLIDHDHRLAQRMQSQK